MKLSSVQSCACPIDILLIVIIFTYLSQCCTQQGDIGSVVTANVADLHENFRLQKELELQHF